ncbi:hypothetical protein LX32DRAFT_688192, partial [Colletotrichum zoysiae]
MEGLPRMSRTMSAGPGPPKSPAPHPPRRGHSVTAGQMTRYRSVRSIREHKSVLDFGRDWREWDVDIFRDDETASNATTDTGTATSLGICIGIAVDEETTTTTTTLDETQAAQTSASASASASTQQRQQQQQQDRPASAAKRRTAPLLTSFSPTPQTPTGAPQLTLHWQWQDLMSASGGSRDENGEEVNHYMMMNKFGFDAGSPVNRGNGAGTGKRIPPVRPDSPDQRYYNNKPLERRHLLLMRQREMHSCLRRRQEPYHHHHHLHLLLLLLHHLNHRRPSHHSFLAYRRPFQSEYETSSSSHSPALIFGLSCANLKLAARANHARSQIITKLALEPVHDDEHIPPTAQCDDRHLVSDNDDDDDDDGQAEREEEDRRRREKQEEEDAARWAAEVARLEEETDRILAEQKAKDLARLQAQLDAIPDTPPRVRSPIVDKFASFLRKGRRSDPATLTKAPSAYFQPLIRDCGPASDMDPSRFIQPGGGGIVPQTDAPTSASNAGER